MDTIVSVLIPSFNTRELSLECIAALLQDPPKVATEIILMDNNSSDGTADAVQRQFPQVRVMRNPGNWGVGKACNQAAKEARGKYFLLLNNDAHPLPGAIDQLVKWLETHPQTGIVGPELVGPEGELLQFSWGWFPVLHGEFLQRFLTPKAVQKSPFRQRLVRFLQRRAGRVPWVCCAAALIRRQAFEEVGGFDEDFVLYFEDSDLCHRCSNKGWQNDFVPEIKAIHRLSQATRPSMGEFSLIYLQSHIVYYQKHAPFWGVWLLKGYLFLKGLKLLAQNKAYGTTFLQVVFEKKSISLPKGSESLC